MGQRTNARGLDLNRDFMKLEAPETRGPGPVPRRVGPCARRRYPRDQRLVPPLYDHLRGAEEPCRGPPPDRLCAGVDASRGRPRGFEAGTDRHAFFYGNFADDHGEWTTFPALPRLRHDVCWPAQPSLRALRGLCLRPVRDPRAGHARLRPRLSRIRRRASGRDPAPAGPSARRYGGCRQSAEARRPRRDPHAGRGLRRAGDGPRFRRGDEERQAGLDRRAERLPRQARPGLSAGGDACGGRLPTWSRRCTGGARDAPEAWDRAVGAPRGHRARRRGLPDRFAGRGPAAPPRGTRRSTWP